MKRRELTQAELDAIGPGPYLFGPDMQALYDYKSRNGLWKARKRGDIPKGIRLRSGRTAWPVEVVREHIASRPAA